MPSDSLRLNITLPKLTPDEMHRKHPDLRDLDADLRNAIRLHTETCADITLSKWQGRYGDPLPRLHALERRYRKRARRICKAYVKCAARAVVSELAEAIAGQLVAAGFGSGGVVPRETFPTFAAIPSTGADVPRGTQPIRSITREGRFLVVRDDDVTDGAGFPELGAFDYFEVDCYRCGMDYDIGFPVGVESVGCPGGCGLSFTKSEARPCYPPTDAKA